MLHWEKFYSEVQREPYFLFCSELIVKCDICADLPQSPVAGGQGIRVCSRSAVCQESSAEELLSTNIKLAAAL